MQTLEPPDDEKVQYFELREGAYVRRDFVPAWRASAQVFRMQSPPIMDASNLVNVRGQLRGLRVLPGPELVGKLDASDAVTVTVAGVRSTHEAGSGQSWSARLPSDTVGEVELVVEGGGVEEITRAQLGQGPEGWTLDEVRSCIRRGGEEYDVQEIFGNTSGTPSERDSCVICLLEARETVILPCRHLCLCHTCAEVIRLRSPNCPICRQHIDSMLRICAEATQVASRRPSVEAIECS